MLNKEAIIYINSRLLAVSMQIDNCKSKAELKKLIEERGFLLYARALVEEKIKRSKKSGL